MCTQLQAPLVVGYILEFMFILGYSSWLVVWNPLLLDPSDGVFGRFDLAKRLRLPHLQSSFVCLISLKDHASQLRHDGTTLSTTLHQNGAVVQHTVLAHYSNKGTWTILKTYT